MLIFSHTMKNLLNLALQYCYLVILVGNENVYTIIILYIYNNFCFHVVFCSGFRLRLLLVLFYESPVPLFSSSGDS